MLIFPNKRFITVISINCSVYGKKIAQSWLIRNISICFAVEGFHFLKETFSRRTGIKIVRDKHTVASVYGKLTRSFCSKYIISLSLEEMK